VLIKNQPISILTHRSIPLEIQPRRINQRLCYHYWEIDVCIDLFVPESHFCIEPPFKCLPYRKQHTTQPIYSNREHQKGSTIHTKGWNKLRPVAILNGGEVSSREDPIAEDKMRALMNHVGD
jgi:hypothetical protein